MTSAYFILKG